MPPTSSRSFWVLLAGILIALHGLALSYSEHLLKLSLTRRADLLLEALLESAEQTLQASHYLEEHIRERLRSIAGEVVAHPERRDQESLLKLQQRYELKTIVIYDAHGRMISASNPDGIAPELPHSFGCNDLLNGIRTEHTFGFSEGVFCEADTFGFAQQLPKGGLVRVLTDVGFVLGFEKHVGLPALIERFRRHPDIQMLELLDVNGRPLLPASSPVQLPLTGIAVSGPLTLHGKTVSHFNLVLADQGMLAMRRTATTAIAVSLTLGLIVLVLLHWRFSRLAEMQEQRRALAEMERQSEGLAHIVATVAHEIRNPLNTLALGLESVRAETVGDTPAPSPRLVARLDLLQKTVRETNDLIQNLLQTTRPILAQPQTLNLGVWFTELRLAFETGFPQTRLEIQPPVPSAVEADPILLRRLMLNLLGNAAQAGARLVTLILTEKDSQPQWAITDDGPGIPPQVQLHLFLPGNTARTDGSGLGLYNARRMAMAMGGRLTLVATGNNGTSFHLILPITQKGNTLT